MVRAKDKNRSLWQSIFSRSKSRPMMVDGQEYFGTGAFKEVYRQMVTNPNVQIVGCKGAEWIRISGTAVFDEDPALFDKAVETMQFLKNLYNEENGRKMGIFHPENGNAQFIKKMMSVEKTSGF